MEFLGYMVTMFDLLKELLNCFPKWLYYFTFPPAVYEGFNFSMAFQIQILPLSDWLISTISLAGDNLTTLPFCCPFSSIHNDVYMS